MSSSSIEKKGDSVLPSSNPSPTPAPKLQQRKNVWIQVAIICFIVFRSTYLYFWHATDKASWTPSNNCPQADVLIPEKNGEIWSELNDKIGSAAFKQTAIDWLTGAVRIPWESRPLKAFSVLIKLLINRRTESYDTMDPVGVDPRYEVFASFHTYLSEAFPLM